MHFARTPAEIDRHKAVVVLVDRLRDSLGDGIDGEWGWIDGPDIDLVQTVPGLRNLGVRLSHEVEDGGAARISRDEAEQIAASVGLYLYECEEPEEPDWSDPEIQYVLAKHYIGTGEWIWTDRPRDSVLCEYGPITLEEHERQVAEANKRRVQMLLGVTRRGVQ